MSVSRKDPKKPERKPLNAVKAEVLRLRLTPAQKELATQAAKQDGRDISSWLRWLINRRASELGLPPLPEQLIDEV